MKKIAFMMMLLLASVGFTAQAATWDFANKGFSDATKANLAADAANWTVNNENRFTNTTTMSGELMANGVIIPETAGIFFGSMSSGKLNIDHGYVPPRVMLNGSNLTFSFKDLEAGQTITLVTMTANTSSSRGITCSSNNATRIAGEETSLEENINVFQVNEDVEGPVEVQFKTLVGGIHIRSVTIDGGAIDPDAPIKIAYLFDSSYANGTSLVGTEEDMILQYGLMQKDVVSIDVKDLTDATNQVFVDSLAGLQRNYDVVVISEAISSSHAFGKALVHLVNRVPMLNLKSFFYKSSVWNWGSGVNPTSVSKGEAGVTSVQVNPEFLEHPIFEMVDVEMGLELFTGDVTDKNLVQAYTPSAGSLIETDAVLATVTNGTDVYNAIHEHGSSNVYMLIPMSSDASQTVSESAIQLVFNAAVYLASTKSTVVPAGKPVVGIEYRDGISIVRMSSSTPSANIYYTLDGTEPTEASLLYTEPLQMTQSATVKAITILQGYDNSSVATAEVLVKTQTAVPVVSMITIEGNQLIQLSATESARIFYTLNGAVPDTLTAEFYTEPFVVSRPSLLRVIASVSGQLVSEIVSDSVHIDGYVLRNKTLVWANFSDQPTVWQWGEGSSTGDVVSKYAYTLPTDDDSTLTPTLTEVDFLNGFKVGTYGQRINLQNTGVAESGNYSPASEGDLGASSFAMSFLTTNASSDPTTAYMVTTEAYAGPFDVTVWFTGAKSTSYTEKLEISIASSLDATEWTVLDTLSSIGDKLIRKQIAYYDSSAPVYVKLASASQLGTNSNMMIFDLKLMGEGSDPVALDQTTLNKTLVSTRIFTVAGTEIKNYTEGINILRKTYSDGSVQIEKKLIKQ